PSVPDEADEHPAPRLPRQVGRADALQRLTPDEVRRLALEPDDAAEPHRERVDVAAQLVAVERHRGLQAQRVAGGQAGGDQVRGGRDQLVPQPRGMFTGEEDLETVLTGVAGAGE